MLRLTAALLLACSASVAAQSDWNELTPTTSPSARRAHAMAYDAGRDRVVVFGGIAFPAIAADDTWEYDGTTWTQITPPTSPPGRRGHAMAYDPVNGRCLLFGGFDTTPLNDTWSWDGQTWTQLQPATFTPPARYSHNLAYDYTRNRIMMFGGIDLSGNDLGDSLYWDDANSDWVPLNPATSPGTRSAAAMCWDPITSDMILYGGYQQFGNTWRYDGTTWSRQPGGMEPGYRFDITLTPDLFRERVVMFGNPLFGADTWEWDGAAWVQIQTTGAPRSRTDHTVVWDSLRRRHLLFGGGGNDDTWEYYMTNPSAHASYGSGCQGSNGTPQLAASGLPWVGESFALTGNGLPMSGPSTLMIGVRSLNVDLTFLGMNGCSLLTDAFATVPLSVFSGQFVFNTVIGPDPTLAGIQLYTQVFNVDPNANTFGVTASNGGNSTIGMK